MTQESLRLHTKPCKTREWAKKDSNLLKNPEEYAVSETGDTKCVTLQSDSDSKLTAVINAWSSLPDAIKVGIMAMVKVNAVIQ
ncbi:MAG: hypothetical protein O3B75_06590 [Planctomycetota bacterium]|nr:hypothetical protein [Planctomycetota bacterium]